MVMSDLRDRGCTCWQSAPCSYCLAQAECQGCGKIFFDDDLKQYDADILVCPDCQDKYRHALEGHELDCTCRACMAFVSEPNAEAGFKVAIPILIEMGSKA